MNIDTQFSKLMIKRKVLKMQKRLGITDEDFEKSWKIVRDFYKEYDGEMTAFELEAEVGQNIIENKFPEQMESLFEMGILGRN